jgi:hypothetical protein
MQVPCHPKTAELIEKTGFFAEKTGKNRSLSRQKLPFPAAAYWFLKSALHFESVLMHL